MAQVEAPVGQEESPRKGELGGAPSVREEEPCTAGHCTEVDGVGEPAISSSHFPGTPVLGFWAPKSRMPPLSPPARGAPI